MTELDDVDAHYHVADLAAVEESGSVQVSWTHPWIVPLGAVSLVARDDRFPNGAEDGDVLWTTEEPVPGRVQEVSEEATGRRYYAVFAADDAGGWRNEVVEGENAVSIEIGGEDTGEEPRKRACGCDGSGGAGLGLVGLALLRRRRRNGL